ncbi:hypothetical protein ACH47B_22100 [Rhodococcus sp. NPDC019627]|uniref:Uncharacterized protein n=1 Tax=Rhodococcus opacus (strain B4) TaxID=632772 RepID=C1BDR6_RHOOB|nr:hypothetical protein ROP_pROB02-01060 [Rhodococcus opacus B4]
MTVPLQRVITGVTTDGMRFPVGGCVQDESGPAGNHGSVPATPCPPDPRRSSSI